MVAVVRFLANGLHGGVAKTLEKVTVLVSGDGLAWIGRTRRSLAAGGADLLLSRSVVPAVGSVGADLDRGPVGWIHSTEKREVGLQGGHGLAVGCRCPPERRESDLCAGGCTRPVNKGGGKQGAAVGDPREELLLWALPCALKWRVGRPWMQVGVVRL